VSRNSCDNASRSRFPVVPGTFDSSYLERTRHTSIDLQSQSANSQNVSFAGLSWSPTAKIVQWERFGIGVAATAQIRDSFVLGPRHSVERVAAIRTLDYQCRLSYTSNNASVCLTFNK
jgi:hypothetical protein